MAHVLLRLASFIVPRGERRRWLEEWTAELWVLDHATAESSRLSPVALSLGALPHSIWQRKEWAMSLIREDLRTAFRALRRDPGFSALALLTIALGIGANTTIFSMANALLLQAPAGIDAPSRVVQVGRDRPDQGFDSLAYPWFRDFREHSESLDGLAAYTQYRMVVGSGGDVTVLPGQIVAGDYFSLLGVEAHVGRLLGPVDDDPQGTDPVAVISHGLWSSRYGGDPAAVGSTITVSGSEFEIVGVAERGFAGTDVVSPATDLWIPLPLVDTVLGPSYAGYDDHGFSWLWVVGRLGAGKTAQSLAAELNALYAPAYAERWGERPNHRIGVIEGIGLRPEERSAVARLMQALLAVVAVVLAVACANLANLLLARGISRSRELSIRGALGASRGRLIRGLLVESLLLAGGGGLAALALTYWTSGVAAQLLPVGIAVSLRPDLSVFAFALGLSLLAGIVFGLLPAWRSARLDLASSFKEASPFAGRRAGLLRGSLVVGQMALSFALLAVTGLMVRSLLEADAADPGYNVRDIATVSVDLDLAGYETERGRQFFDELVRSAAALPGAQAATMSTNLPFAGWRREGIVFPEPQPEGQRQFVEVDSASVDANFFETLQIPMLAGEGFTPANSGPEMQPVVVISESAAELFWPGDNALGKLLPRTEARIPEESLRVVGVVADVQVRSLRQPPRPSIYRAVTQDYVGSMTVMTRGAGDAATLLQPLQALVRELDPDVGILQVGVLHDRLRRSLSDTTTVARLGGIFGLLAAVLAAVGLYGVIAYVASSRRAEVGVRIALGARNGDVLGLFLRQALALTGIGVLLGIALTIAASGAISSFLYGVSARDPITLAVIGGCVLSLALLAAVGPALRASRADPVAALRGK